MKLFKAYFFLIFLSLTAPSIAFRYAKPGCEHMCGNVIIPYPFGIGSTCSVNEWYNVDCKSSRPYLSKLNNWEIKVVDLDNQTVVVNMPKISDCRNSSQTKTVDLGSSPFVFSKPHNTFVYKGCGNAVMTYDGSVITGCSTTCRNDTVIGDVDNCLGINCCQASIPRYLKSYTMDLISLEGQLGGDEDCGSAFLVDKNSVINESFSSQSSVALGEDPFVPVSLLWTLSDIDFKQVTCYGDDGDYTSKEKLKVDTGIGTSVDTWKCSSCRFSSTSSEGSPYLINGCAERLREYVHYAKSGCNDTCGNIRIPYPFGFGAKCCINEWYNVDCISSKPYLSKLKHVEVVSVDLENQTVAVNMPMMSADCRDQVRMSADLSGTPFLFSKSKNKFVFKGCGNAGMMHNGSVITGCSTICPNESSVGDKNSCYGIGCCQATIPQYLTSYSINVTSLEGQSGGCVSAFLVDENSYNSIAGGGDTTITSLRWTLSDLQFQLVTCCRYQSLDELDLGNGTSVDTGICTYPSSSIYQGNPYLTDGCEYKGYEDVDPVCAKCKHKGGYCIDHKVYDVDGNVYKTKYSCYGSRILSLGVLLGLSISMGAFFLVATSYVLYRVIKKTKERRRRKRFFKRNGGLLLKQQQEADSSLVDKTIHFKSRELEKATDNFNENRILGRGGQGTVYKGMLVDGRIVAIKKSKIVDESQLEQFINEVVILSQVNHRNVVKLLGCCLETEVPLLVSEFISNGTLFDRLHNNNDEFPISLNMRLQIASEVAGALAYLHSATSIPIYHRDVKTTNILLDDKYRAKVSDFGTSRFVAIDQTHLTTLVIGTFGYLDPEYFQTSQFTEKSDVYSFGVVLVELLTGERPISLTRFGETRSLATYFMLAMEEGRVMSIFDALVIKEGTRDELIAVANLAMQCLNMNGKFRPTMIEVSMELETIRKSHVPSMVHEDIGPVIYGEQLSTFTNGESTSTFLSYDENSG